MSECEQVNVVLVDDQPDKLLTYEAILHELGEHLLKAGSAREALEYLLKTDIAVILMDVRMPEIDGFELAKMIRDHPRYQQTAIIFISAVHRTDFDQLQGYAHGGGGYVAVPGVPELFRGEVGGVVDLFRKTPQLAQLDDGLGHPIAEVPPVTAERHRPGRGGQRT